MNDVIKTSELDQEILNLLLKGESVENICKQLDCDIYATDRVLGCDIFATLADDALKQRLKTAALRSVTILSQLANDETIGANPRIRASQVLLDKALDIKDLAQGETPAAEMSQAQLITRLNDLQAEANRRTKVIEQEPIDMQEMLS